jgi:Resolvase, N terminal domain
MQRMLELGHRCSIAAVDRLSRDTTDLLVIARDLQKAGAGLRSLTEPVVDTTSARRKSPWREIRTQAETHAALEARSDQAPR